MRIASDWPGHVFFDLRLDRPFGAETIYAGEGDTIVGTTEGRAILAGRAGHAGGTAVNSWMNAGLAAREKGGDFWKAAAAHDQGWSSVWWSPDLDDSRWDSIPVPGG